MRDSRKDLKVQIVTFNAPIIVSKLEAHQKIKRDVLDAIDQMGRIPRITDNGREKLSHTDWHLSEDTPRTYWDIVSPHINDINASISSRLQYASYFVSNFWFQWYEQGDYHKFHTHPICTFSNVYYVQLTNSNPKTQFLLNGQVFEIAVTEGDVLTFPSFLAHEAPVNKSSTPKVVIAFNTNFFMEPTNG